MVRRVSLYLAVGAIAACGKPDDKEARRKQELDRAVEEAGRNRLKEITGSDEAPPEGCNDPLPRSMGTFAVELGARGSANTRAHFVAERGGQIAWRESKYGEARGWLEMFLMPNAKPFTGTLATGTFELAPSTGDSRGIQILVTSIESSHSGGTAFDAVSGQVTIESIDERAIKGSLSNVVLRGVDRHDPDRYVDVRCATRIDSARFTIARGS